MNPNKDHYNLRGRVPFSWEKMQAWVGKAAGGQHSAEETGRPLLLPPPPSRRWSLESSKAAAAHGIPIRLPLWASPRPPRSSASNKKNKKGEQEEEDPFMLALSECTRSPQQRQQRRINKKKVSVRIKKISIKIRSLSCRQLSSCAVAGVDNFYTAGRPPHNPNDPRHRKGEEKRLLATAYV